MDANLYHSSTGYIDRISSDWICGIQISETIILVGADPQNPERVAMDMKRMCHVVLIDLVE
jgi:hypothetical protein